MTSLPERRSREIRSARASRRPPSFAVTLVALAIVFAIAWIFFLRSGPVAPTPQVDGIRGTYTWNPGTGRASEDGAFSAVASGNAGGEVAIPMGTTASGRRPAASTYDATTRTETTVGDGLIGWYGISIGEWPPVWRVATRSPLDYQGLAAIVRTAIEDGDDAVGIKPLKDGDRAVWRAAMTLGGQPVALVVDQQTGIVTWYTDGRATFTASVDWASPPPADKTYTIDTRGLPASTTTADAFTYVPSPAAAGRMAGYDPLVSDLTPDGYSLKAAATFDEATRLMEWVRGAAYGPPPSDPGEPGIALLYTRGLSSMTVEQIGPNGDAPLRSRAPRRARTSRRGTSSRTRRRRWSTAPSGGRRPRPGTRRAGRPCSSHRAPGGVRHRRPHPAGAHRVRGRAEARPREK